MPRVGRRCRVGRPRPTLPRSECSPKRGRGLGSAQDCLMVETEHPTMTAGSTLRFRVVDPTRGIESSTWSIVGSKKSGDLYFSGREIMSDLKISLHASGMNRIAWTTAVASSRVAPGADRVLSRWNAVDLLPNGWALASGCPYPTPRYRQPCHPLLNAHPSQRSHSVLRDLGARSRFEFFAVNRDVEASAWKANSRRSAE